MNCTSSPSTSAPRASLGTNAAERRPCDPAHAASGTQIIFTPLKPFIVCTENPPYTTAWLAFSALDDLHPVTTMRSSWWTTSTRSGFLRWAPPAGNHALSWTSSTSTERCSATSSLTGHRSDGGKDSGNHPQQLPGERPPSGRWRAWLRPPPDNWTGAGLSGKEPARSHHIQLLLRTHWQTRETRSRGRVLFKHVKSSENSIRVHSLHTCLLGFDQTLVSLTRKSGSLGEVWMCNWTLIPTKRANSGPP